MFLKFILFFFFSQNNDILLTFCEILMGVLFATFPIFNGYILNSVSFENQQKTVKNTIKPFD